MIKEKIIKKNTNIIIILFMIMFFVLDRLFKILSLKTREDFSIIKDFFKFTFFPNEFISFSIPFSGAGLKIILSLLLILIIFYLILNFKSKKYNEFLAFFSIFLGALSNFFDRIYYSYVIDYLNLMFFSVFNLADVLIVGGCLYLIILNLKSIKK
jgi:signal peptidase II